MPIRSLYIWPVAMWRWVEGAAGELFYGDNNYARNYLTGSTGNDTIAGCGWEYTSMLGGAGNDQLYAGQCGEAVLFGGTGNNKLQGNFGADKLDGEDGNDTMYGMGGNDTISDTSGNNLISGNDGHDRIYTRDGLQRVWGDAGRDTITGDNAARGSEFHGGREDDTIKIYGTDVTIWGDEGNDKITFSGHANNWGAEVYGGSGNDTISISGGYVDVEGGAGADEIDFTNGGNIIVHYNSIAESQRGASDRIKSFGYDRTNFIDISSIEGGALDLFWVNNVNDRRVGAVYLQNNWTNSKLYAYGANNAVLELTFESSGHLTRDMFYI